MPLGRLHVLTDYTFQQRYTPADLARRAIAGGADTIQFRDKQIGIRHKLVAAQRTAGVCAAAKIPLVIDDHIDIALTVNAEGVHLGQEDFPVAAARRLLGDDALIGATVTSVEQARQAADEGATYLGFGPVYTTRSKVNPASVKGLNGLEAVCTAVYLPVIAIAGLLPERVRPVLEAGAYGIAVMTAISTAPDPTAATAAFRKEINAFLNVANDA